MNNETSIPYGEPPQSPLFHAQNAGRYDRQQLIQDYESRFSCRLVVMIDSIFYDSVTLLEELLYDCDPNVDLHLMINSFGGLGEVAVRLVRSAQAHCRELTIIVPDQAKSAATLVAVGGHHIIMGSASDLGPVDPQFFDGQRWVAAKDIIQAVEDAIQQIQDSPDTYPIHAALLGDVTAIMVQQARSAMGGAEATLLEALCSNPDRSDQEVQHLLNALRGPLIEVPQTHAALFGMDDAMKAGLPVQKAAPDSNQWRMLWRLWAKYFALGISTSIYESSTTSQVFQRGYNAPDF